MKGNDMNKHRAIKLEDMVALKEGFPDGIREVMGMDRKHVYVGVKHKYTIGIIPVKVPRTAIIFHYQRYAY